ncbi:class I SAM-dependent methyltransferase [Acuticoccus sp. M5D2P5]|uniref:class I SAM-dependent methyltransferase n=1 Tax=Acuticoccus kalidii TaxID=2910977 RepID=UPI001F1F0815|nr:class I SAM-dependent methyltransferase [Acuticoccus kalidii]MCF3935947.1 class I SAM-dependent methyltransferase [Acuticoccus kalidii]
MERIGVTSGGRNEALTVLVSEPEGYRLLDSGNGQKLEQYGDVRLVRPEPQAMWRPRDPAAWDVADARFEGSDDDDGPGRWSAKVPDWTVDCGPARMICRIGNNRHVGLFPEQQPHWDAASAMVAAAARDGREPRILNLFGYTGAASLILAAAGAEVTHVDASKKAIAWARENQAASRLDDKPIRWICDDASKFVAREVRRERRYDGILLDPPKFGRGPKNEVWNLFDDLPPLLADVRQIVAEDALFVILTAYAIRASALAVGRLMEEAMEGRGGTVTAGELALSEASGGLLPTSMFATWRP